MTNEVILSVIAIIVIAGLNIAAMSCGINGALLSTSFAIIGGLAGYQVKGLRDRKKNK